MILRFIIAIVAMLSAIFTFFVANICIVGGLGMFGTPGNGSSGSGIIAIIGFSLLILSLFVFFNGIMVLINWNWGNKPNAVAYSKYGIYPATVVVAITLFMFIVTGIYYSLEQALKNKYEKFVSQHKLHLTEDMILTLKSDNLKNVAIEVTASIPMVNKHGIKQNISKTLVEKKYETSNNEPQTFNLRKLIEDAFKRNELTKDGYKATELPKDFDVSAEMYPIGGDFTASYYILKKGLNNANAMWTTEKYRQYKSKLFFGLMN